MTFLISLITLLIFTNQPHTFANQLKTLDNQPYPKHWWTPVEKSQLHSWEIPPQSAKPGEVILSKRNELGILSNFAETPFTLDGVAYQSIEGFWQMMKYPENSKDERALSKDIHWPMNRQQVSQLIAFDAKKAGDIGTKNMERLKINWVTYRNKKISYRVPKKGAHYQLILRAMEAKMNQNPKVKQVLLQTKGLKLKPDHHTPPDSPPAWRYYDIWMILRDKLQEK